jgi:hypothetical protein
MSESVSENKRVGEQKMTMSEKKCERGSVVAGMVQQHRQPMRSLHTHRPVDGGKSGDWLINKSQTTLDPRELPWLCIWGVDGLIITNLCMH